MTRQGQIEIIPTIVPATFADIRSASERYAHFAHFFQIDLADGKFAPNTTWLPSKGDVFPKEYKYEVHMMVSDPLAIGSLCAASGAHSLITHLETLPEVERTKETFTSWKQAGVHSIGLAILLQTPLDTAEPYLPLVDFVLLMTIPRIGVQGIPFDKSASARVEEFHRRFPTVPIAVDGGVSGHTISALTRAGARHFGVGSAIAKSPDPAAAYASLMRLAEGALP